MKQNANFFHRSDYDLKLKRMKPKKTVMTEDNAVVKIKNFLFTYCPSFRNNLIFAALLIFFRFILTAGCC
jgi:hypothetical protein